MMKFDYGHEQTGTDVWGQSRHKQIGPELLKMVIDGYLIGVNASNYDVNRNCLEIVSLSEYCVVKG